MTRASNDRGVVTPRARVRELAAKEAETESDLFYPPIERELGEIEADLIRESKRELRTEPAVSHEGCTNANHCIAEPVIKRFFQDKILCKPVKCTPVKPDKNGRKSSDC